jgi:peptidoglycan/xylan/chitin deacetylase (PgdA/CDA1 family)
MILSYHNIIGTLPDAFDRRAGRIHVDRFRGQMERIALHHKPVSLRSYLDNLHSPDSKRKDIAVTFDDAHHGVLDHAGPVLQRLGIPATVFVVTLYASPETRLFHFDEVEIALRLTSQTELHMDTLGEPRSRLDSIAAKIACMTRIKRKMKTIPEEKRQLCQRELLNRLRIGEDQCREYARRQDKYRIICWSELRKMVQRGWGIGSHTRSHPVLAQLKSADLDAELRDSKDDIRRELGLAEIPFAYPYGGEDHIGALSPKAVRRAGYTCALTTIPGVNDGQTDLYRLRRVSTSTG